RNTYFRGYFDERGKLTGFDKFAYNEIELSHRYTYRDIGNLSSTVITDIDGETTTLFFDVDGNPA
ncbi:MAG: DUF6156 family protein, partial [Gallionella sp.]